MLNKINAVWLIAILYVLSSIMAMKFNLEWAAKHSEWLLIALLMLAKSLNPTEIINSLPLKVAEEKQDEPKSTTPQN
ncbi:MAG: hypothetical protein WAQ98_21365 [Blastocatellia bacterium]